MNVRSMTGFARVRRQLETGDLTLSVKSVNHRALDMHFHMPGEFDAIEPAFRTEIKKHVSRGHVQVHLSFAPASPNGSAAAPALNEALLSAWLQAFRQAAERHGLHSEPDLNDALRIPGMFQGDAAPELPGEVEEQAVPVLLEALEQLNAFRGREGEAIRLEIHQRSLEIQSLVARIEKIRAGATGAFQKRLKERLGELLRGVSIDPQRLVQEAAILTDRSDISEELIRLKTHAAQLDDLMAGAGEKGKRLDFLLQEMNREANTILSKTGGLGDLGLTITELALAAKSEIDKIREQSLNIE